ncbi:hypothetical protein R6Z07F_015095 [Ovis aries]
MPTSSTIHVLQLLRELLAFVLLSYTVLIGALLLAGRCSASDLCPDGPERPANERTLQGRGPETLSKHPSRRPTPLASF